MKHIMPMLTAMLAGAFQHRGPRVERLTDRACRARLTTTALATGVSGLLSDITDLKATMAQGPGVGMKVAPTNVTGDGTAKHAHFTMPNTSYLNPTSGHKYELNGVIYVRATDGEPIQVGVRSVDKLVLSYSGSAWNVRRDGQYVISNKHATFATYYASEADFPDIEDDAGALSLLHTEMDTMAVVIEADFTITDLGADS